MSLMQGRSDEEQLTIVERLRKCHHPSLAEGNKEKLETLFSLLVQVRSSPLHTDSLDMTSSLCVCMLCCSTFVSSVLSDRHHCGSSTNSYRISTNSTRCRQTSAHSPCAISSCRSMRTTVTSPAVELGVASSLNWTRSVVCTILSFAYLYFEFS